MPSLSRKPTSSQTSNHRDSRSRRSSGESYGSKSTTPTSVYNSPRPSELKGARARGQASPDASLYPRSSVDTYASTGSSADELDAMDLDDGPGDGYDESCIPPLPAYHQDVVEPNVRPCSPQDFSKLFPSLNRLTIRHDEFTTDGNM